MKMPSSLQKLRDRVTSRRSLPRRPFTKRCISAPSCLHDVNLKMLSEPLPELKKHKLSSHSFKSSLKSLKRLGTTLAPPSAGTPLLTREHTSETPIQRSSLSLVRSKSRRRSVAVAGPLSPVCEEPCPDSYCLMCSLVKPELKRRHSTIMEPTFMRNFYWNLPLLSNILYLSDFNVHKQHMFSLNKYKFTYLHSNRLKMNAVLC